MNKTPLIQVNDLRYNNGKEVLFDAVSLSIREHAFVSIKGPSGCGKTTLLRILTGLAKPTKGTIFIDGKLANDPAVLIPPHKRDMSLLFQDLALWPHMSGEEQLRFVWEAKKVGNFNEKVKEVCTSIGLPFSLLSKYPGELSGGEKQRLAIARTMIAYARIVLLDEPLTALDHNLRDLFLRYLKEIRRKRTTTVVIVSHDLFLDLIDVDQVITFANGTFLKL